jgi:hypothetical protein
MFIKINLVLQDVKNNKNIIKFMAFCIGNAVNIKCFIKKSNDKNY